MHPDLAERVERLRSERVPHVFATVVRAERPTSAKPGDSALVLEDGTIEGFVGGACAESTVRAQSLQTLVSGEPTLLRITPTPEPAPPDSGEDPTPGLVSVSNPCLSGGTLDIFLEPSLPPPLVLVYGDAPIAQALLRAGGDFGFETRAARAGATIPEGTAAVVVATHGRDEETILDAAHQSGVPYIGLVASRRRGNAVLDTLPGAAGTVHTPAGLDIGARTPGEVALSILAEIVATRPRRPAQPAPLQPQTEAGGEAPAATATDPVCGMEVATVRTSLHADHEGTRYWFCGPGCRDAFVAAPDRYESGPPGDAKPPPGWGPTE